MAPDIPAATSAALILSPIDVAIVMFLGAFDMREIRRKISPLKAAFNRCQISLGSALASWLVHRLVLVPARSDYLLPLSLFSLAVATLANYVLVTIPLALEARGSLKVVLRKLKLGTTLDLAITFVAWGVLAAMLVALYERSGQYALLAFVAPALLGRQVLMRSEMYLVAERAYRSRETALFEMANTIQAERSDERRLIAADLHDEVLQPMFRVSLIANILKTDLSSGRLLEMEEDLPQLLAATEVTAGALRDLIGDLRRSTLGRSGLPTALRGLMKELETRTSISFHSDISVIEADALVELATYQIAKEALGNAIEHAKAENIWVSLSRDEKLLHLTVRDDGIGFEPYFEKPGHYGLHIMRERATSIGGQLYIDSRLGEGCIVTLLAQVS